MIEVHSTSEAGTPSYVRQFEETTALAAAIAEIATALGIEGEAIAAVKARAKAVPGHVQLEAVRQQMEASRRDALRRPEQRPTGRSGRQMMIDPASAEHDRQAFKASLGGQAAAHAAMAADADAPMDPGAAFREEIRRREAAMAAAREVGNGSA